MPLFHVCQAHTTPTLLAVIEVLGGRDVALLQTFVEFSVSSPTKHQVTLLSQPVTNNTEFQVRWGQSTTCLS